MNELKCPKCGYDIQLDDAIYDSIVNQVRNSEFESELERRVNELKKQHEAETRANEMEAESRLAKSLSELKAELTRRDMEIKTLNDKISAVKQASLREMESEIAKKDAEIVILNKSIKDIESQKEMEFNARLSDKEKEIARLEEQIESSARERKLEFDNILFAKEAEITALQNKIDQADSAREIAVLKERQAVTSAISEKDSQIQKLQSQIELTASEIQHRENVIKESYEAKIKDREDEIQRLKDFKARLSTKMLGESLEQHCYNSFNMNRMQMFPFAYFEKDNDATPGTKGDFIFKDYCNGEEYISIMFEMKNEGDDSTYKHKNEDFLEKLDRDRRAKGCEYAVLVTMLEPDNELYNQGIVNVSYRYPKMFIVRPQFFISIISLLCQVSLSNVKLKRELDEAKQMSIDVSDFEQKWLDFQESFGKSFNWAHERFQDAIKEIDKTIKMLENIKEQFTKSDKHFQSANNKAQELTIKKLTKGNPTMTRLFDEARNSDNALPDAGFEEDPGY